MKVEVLDLGAKFKRRRPRRVDRVVGAVSVAKHHSKRSEL